MIFGTERQKFPLTLSFHSPKIFQRLVISNPMVPQCGYTLSVSHIMDRVIVHPQDKDLLTGYG